VLAGAEGIAVSCTDANKLTATIDRAVENGVPVATFAIGKPGAINAALFAAAILAADQPAIRAAWHAFRADQTAAVLAAKLP